jgi:hypothetical protein
MAKFLVSENRGDARQLEKYIKGRKSKYLIETIVLHHNSAEYINKLKLLSTVG